jgi:hypothetical protein
VLRLYVRNCGDFIAVKCEWRQIPKLQDARGWRRYECKHCGRLTPYTPHKTEQIDLQRECEGRPAVPGESPGGQLHDLIHQLGIEREEGCGCAAMIRQMNRWGCAGCEEHFDEIVAHLRKAYKEQSWSAVTAASMAAFSTGIAWKLYPFNQIESLVRLAIARARENANIPT